MSAQHTPMHTFSCTVLIDASKGKNIEAETPMEAADKAIEEIGHVRLCHQCSKDLETGDALGVIVYDEDDNEVLNNTYNAEEIRRLEKRCETLTAQRDELLEALKSFVNHGTCFDEDDMAQARAVIAKTEGGAA